MTGLRRCQNSLLLVSVLFNLPGNGQALATDNGGKVVILVAASKAVVVRPATIKESRVLYRRHSLPAALQLARDLRRNGKARQVTIELSRGIHRLRRAVKLTAADSGTQNAPLIIRGQGANSSIVSGAIDLKPAPALPALLKRLPMTARRHVRFFKLPDNFAKGRAIDVARTHNRPTPPPPFEVFDRQGAARPARWPNAGNRSAKFWAIGKKSNSGAAFVAFATDKRRAERLRGEANLWVGGYFRWNWSFETLPAKPLQDSATNGIELRLAKPPLYGIAKAFRGFVYHALSELDEPGEWYLDARSRRLVIWPRQAQGKSKGKGKGKDRSKVTLSRAKHLLIIAGAKNIRIEKLTIEKMRGDAVTVTDSRNIILSHIGVRYSGGRAVVFDRSQLSGIRNSQIADSGDGGITLAGGARKTLEPANLFAQDNIIRRFARLGRTYRPGVFISGVGNRVIGNYIGEAPHSGIIFSGNNHLIAFNEIAKVATETDDAGAIYTGRDWTARGTNIVNNFLHDIGPPQTIEQTTGSGEGVKGIMLDDFASGTSVKDNLFLRVPKAVFIGGGRDNKVSGNLFLGSNPAIYMDSRGASWAAEHITKRDGELRTALAAMPIASPLWRQHYPHLTNILRDQPALAKYNIVRDNIVVAGEALYLSPDVNAKLQTIVLRNSLAYFWARRSGTEPKLASQIAKLQTATDIARFLNHSRYLSAKTTRAIPFAELDRLHLLLSSAVPAHQN